MEIETLKTFVAVVRGGSFASVARANNVDPSLVSRTIAGLEAELGVRLLQRSTRQMSLTEAGRLYLNRIEPVLDELSDAHNEASALASSPQGVLRISASVAFGHVCIVPLISKFQAEFPEVELELVLTDDNLDMVAEQIDIAIRLAPSINTDVVCSKLFQTSYRVCATPDYIKKSPDIRLPEDIRSHSAILFSLPRFRTNWLFTDQSGDTTDVAVGGNIVISNALSIKECMLAGQGPALLADWMIDKEISAGQCVDLFPDYRVSGQYLDTGAWLIYPSRKFLARKVRLVIDFLQLHLRKPA